jgi:hypothetical protein
MTDFMIEAVDAGGCPHLKSPLRGDFFLFRQAGEENLYSNITFFCNKKNTRSTRLLSSY